MTRTLAEHRAELWQRIETVGTELELFASRYNLDMTEEQHARKKALLSWIRHGHLLKLIDLAVELDKAANDTQEVASD